MFKRGKKLSKKELASFTDNALITALAMFKYGENATPDKDAALIRQISDELARRGKG